MTSIRSRDQIIHKTGPNSKERNLGHSAKCVPSSAGTPPVGPVPPLAPQLKRGRGRPRKNPLIAATSGLTPSSQEPKALKTFRKMVADLEELSPPTADGGGTAENTLPVTKESLERRVSRRLNVLDRYLTDDKLIELMAFSTLKEIGIYEAIMLDKALILKGQPNVIIGQSDRQDMQDALPRLLADLKRRKLITTVSERKIEFTEAS